MINIILNMMVGMLAVVLIFIVIMLVLGVWVVFLSIKSAFYDNDDEET